MGGIGQWAFPDGSLLLNNKDSADAGQQFYRLRNEPQLIRLARRQNVNPLTPTGSYCCTVPTTGGEMTLCANLGEWIVLVGKGEHALAVVFTPILQVPAFTIHGTN